MPTYFRPRLNGRFPRRSGKPCLAFGKEPKIKWRKTKEWKTMNNVCDMSNKLSD